MQKRWKYKLKNAFGAAPAGFKPGYTMKLGDSIEEAPSFRAVILLAADARTLFLGQGQPPACQSFDGHSPAPRVMQPQCNKLTEAGIVAIISQFKGYTAAKYQQVITDLTCGSDKLQKCGIVTKTGVIPICPKARDGKCKAQLILIGYDLDNKREFELVLDGASIRRMKDRQAPYHDMKDKLQQLGLAPHQVTVRIGTKVNEFSPSKSNLADFMELKPIAKQENADKHRVMAEAAFKEYQVRAMYVHNPDKKAGFQKELPDPKETMSDDEKPHPLDFLGKLPRSFNNFGEE